MAKKELRGLVLSKYSFRLSLSRGQKSSELFDFLGVKGENFGNLMREFINEFHCEPIIDRSSLAQ